MAEQIRNVISNNGLKIKLYIIDCPQCSKCWKIDSFEKNPKHYEYELSENIDGSKFLPHDICREKTDKIFYELKNSLFIGYSCVWIVIDMLWEYQVLVMETIFECIKANNHLKYKTKIIQSVDRSMMLDRKKHECTNSDLEALMSNIVTNETFSPKLKNLKKLQQPPIPTIEELFPNYEMYMSYTHWADKTELMKNSVYLQSIIRGDQKIDKELESLLIEIYNSPFTTVPSVIVKNTADKDYKRLTFYSAMDEFYFYSINPALAIIINQYHFTSNHNRKGSDIDVLCLTHELKVAAIPFILIEDCNKKQLIKILKYLLKKDFWPLEKFLFFMMSHGDADGYICTTDDKVHIMNDIVKAIEDNESLKSSTKLCCMNNCRGIINADHADCDDFEEIKPTDNSTLDDSTVLLYSVPDQIKSPRSAQHGTPLIASLCKHFRTIYHNDSIRTLVDNVNKSLENTKYYKNSEKLTAELVCKDIAANQNVLPLPIVATDMIRLVESIVKDTETMFEKMLTYPQTSGEGNNVALKTTFHITGNLCKKTIELNPLMQKYFSQQLNDDCSELVENFENVPVEELSKYINNEFFKRKL